MPFPGSSFFQNRYHQLAHLDYVIPAYAVGHDVIGHDKMKVYRSTYMVLKTVLGYLLLFKRYDHVSLTTFFPFLKMFEKCAEQETLN